MEGHPPGIHALIPSSVDSGGGDYRGGGKSIPCPEDTEDHSFISFTRILLLFTIEESLKDEEEHYLHSPLNGY